MALLREKPCNESEGAGRDASQPLTAVGRGKQLRWFWTEGTLHTLIYTLLFEIQLPFLGLTKKEKLPTFGQAPHPDVRPYGTN